MTELELQKSFFEPTCNKDEIERIFNPKSSDVYLLKMRAETVIDNMRLFRAIRNRRLRNIDNWNFTDHFSTIEFENYIRKLSPELRERTVITQGFLFSNDPNGSLIRTEFGDIINVSEALRYFLFFMNLCYLEFDVEIPESVREASRMIAIRTMLKTETLDFEQDPRGIIPNQVTELINDYVEKQLEFIIGHEFAHHFCNHLDSSNINERSLYRPLKNEDSNNFKKFYNHNQKQEFEADVFSLSSMNLPIELKEQYIYHAILFFAYLEVYQTVSDYIFPPNKNYNTHPVPRERMWNIYSNFDFEVVSFNKENIENLVKRIEYDKTWLIEDVGFNIENYETYGSAYLAEPNTEWRGKELIDRVDFY